MRLPEIDLGGSFADPPADRLHFPDLGDASAGRGACGFFTIKNFSGFRWELGLRRRCAARARGASASVS